MQHEKCERLLLRPRLPEERQTQVVQTCPELPPQDVFWGTSG